MYIIVKRYYLIQFNGLTRHHRKIRTFFFTFFHSLTQLFFDIHLTSSGDFGSHQQLFSWVIKRRVSFFSLPYFLSLLFDTVSIYLICATLPYWIVHCFTYMQVHTYENDNICLFLIMLPILRSTYNFKITRKS